MSESDNTEIIKVEIDETNADNTFKFMNEEVIYANSIGKNSVVFKFVCDESVAQTIEFVFKQANYQTVLLNSMSEDKNYWYLKVVWNVN